ncbi:MAG: hypothetical protein K2Q06_12190 [Parvularculaceae bacterium]|nr:hypothetical protein [Parvularculaceae bacterium]
MTNMPFVKMLTELRGGEIEALASARLAEALAALAERGGEATLTLKLKIKRTEHGHIEVKPDLAVKVPEPKLKTAIFWLTEDGRLSRRDPGQADIEDVPGVKRPQTIEARFGVRAVD